MVINLSDDEVEELIKKNNIEFDYEAALQNIPKLVELFQNRQQEQEKEEQEIIP